MTYLVCDGPAPRTITESTQHYYRECAASGHGSVQVVLPDGTTDYVTGNRYMRAGTCIEALQRGGRIDVVYEGSVLRSWPQWSSYTVAR